MSSILFFANKRSGRSKAIRSQRSRFMFIAAVSSLILIALVAVFADFITPFDPEAVDFTAVNAPPGTSGHILGTDQNGRDILSRLIAASRVSLLGPLCVSLISASAGMAVGAYAAWKGGWVDSVLSRIVDFTFAFPGLLLAVFAVALFSPGIVAPVIALSIALMPMGARLVRALVQQELSKDYVRALRTLGYSGGTIMVRHVLPNIAPPILSQTILGFSYALVDLAAVSYLGLGVQPPGSDWGLMIAEGQSALLLGSPWSVIWPSLVIIIVVVLYNYVGEHFVDRFGKKVK